MTKTPPNDKALGEAFYAACLAESLWVAMIMKETISAQEARERLDSMLLKFEKWSLDDGSGIGSAAMSHAKLRLEGLVKQMTKLAMKSEENQARKPNR